MDAKRRLTEFVQLSCPCFHGGSCNRVGKVVVKDEEELPKGISRVEMEMFRLLDLCDETMKSFAYESVRNFTYLILCPTLRNLFHSLRLRIPSSSASSHAPADTSRNPGKENSYHQTMDLELGMSPEEMAKYISFWCARTVIADYNKKHATNYKLVEPINGRGFVDFSICYHCVFTAIDTNTSISAAPDLFFAEIQKVQRGVHDVVATRILDDTEITYDWCAACEKLKVPHPVNGFKQGLVYHLRPPQELEYSKQVSNKRLA